MKMYNIKNVGIGAVLAFLAVIGYIIIGLANNGLQFLSEGMQYLLIYIMIVAIMLLVALAQDFKAYFRYSQKQKAALQKAQHELEQQRKALEEVKKKGVKDFKNYDVAYPGTPEELEAVRQRSDIDP